MEGEISQTAMTFWKLQVNLVAPYCYIPPRNPTTSDRASEDPILRGNIQTGRV